MGPYLGDFVEDSVINHPWDTNDANGASITRAVDGSIRIYKNNTDTQKTTANGITDTEDFDGLVGIHQLSVDTSDDTGDVGFWERGNDYFVVLQGATIDGQTVNAVLCSFSIENRSRLNVILGAVQSATLPGNRTSSPVPLEMYQNEQKTFLLTVNDSSGDPVDLSAMTLRFVVHDENDTTAAVFKVELPDITTSGVSNEIANVTVSAAKAATANSSLLWKLWDITGEQVLMSGNLKIKTAKKDSP